MDNTRIKSVIKPIVKSSKLKFIENTYTISYGDHVISNGPWIGFYIMPEPHKCRAVNEVEYDTSIFSPDSSIEDYFGTEEDRVMITETAPATIARLLIHNKRAYNGKEHDPYLEMRVMLSRDGHTFSLDENDRRNQEFKSYRAVMLGFDHIDPESKVRHPITHLYIDTADFKPFVLPGKPGDILLAAYVNEIDKPQYKGFLEFLYDQSVHPASKYNKYWSKYDSELLYVERFYK